MVQKALLDWENFAGEGGWSEVLWLDRHSSWLLGLGVHSVCVLM